MNLTLSPGDKLTFAAPPYPVILAELLAGHIRHIEPAFGKSVVLVNNGNGTSTLTASIVGDYTGDGVITLDDQLADIYFHVGEDFAVRII